MPGFPRVTDLVAIDSVDGGILASLDHEWYRVVEARDGIKISA